MNLGAKLAGLAAMGISSFVAPKLAGQTWKFVTGEEPPSEDEGSNLTQILIFAALSAVLVTAIQVGADRVTAKMLGSTEDHSEEHKA